ncbi:MAG: DUF547 domain-containing protein [Deltaproteobacteria bacterium]|nr:DUF547 domain-containing protein [Deltaproteobacteria bacterium]
MSRLVFALALALLVTVAPSAPDAIAGESSAVASADGFDHAHAQWDGVLRAHVDGKGMVAYAKLKTDSTALDAYLNEVATVPAEEVGGWSKSRQIAFYINAYNALTFRAILDAYPTKSIRDIKPDAWENSRWTVAGRTVSLNWIEHTKLRGHFGESRVHFVLVCAAIGCPRLPNRAVLSGTLEAQLDAATKAFFVDPAKNRVDAEGGKVYLSRIMEWYGDDFVGWGGTPATPALDGRAAKEAAAVRLLGKFVSDEDQAFLAKNSFTVIFNDYDWALNSQ